MDPGVIYPPVRTHTNTQRVYVRVHTQIALVNDDWGFVLGGFLIAKTEKSFSTLLFFATKIGRGKVASLELNC